MTVVSVKSDTVRPLGPLERPSSGRLAGSGRALPASGRAARDAGERGEAEVTAVALARLAREMRVSKALREVGVALGTTLDLDELLELILAKITEALEADRTTLYLLDEANDELVSRIAQGDAVRSIRLKNGRGIAGHVARTGHAAARARRLRGPALQPRVGHALRLPHAVDPGRADEEPPGQDHRRRAGAQQEPRRVHRRRRRHPRGAGHAGRREHRQLAALHVGHAEEHPAARHQASSSSTASATSSCSSISSTPWAGPSRSRSSSSPSSARRCARAKPRWARWRCAIPSRGRAPSTSSTSARRS